jgi:hypothetical protein
MVATMKTKTTLITAFSGQLTLTAIAAPVDGGSVLPFPPSPSVSVAGPTFQESRPIDADFRSLPCPGRNAVDVPRRNPDAAL